MGGLGKTFRTASHVEVASIGGWSVAVANGTKAPMHDFARTLITAITLVGSFDPDIVRIVALSLRVSLSASIIATIIGAPLGGVSSGLNFANFTARVLISAGRGPAYRA
jgi:hypothetical protein